MARAPTLSTVSTRRLQIAKMAKEAPDMALTNVAHHVDVEWLREAWRLTRKNGAVGIDEQTADAYKQRLEDNLQDLHERLKTGRYRAQAT